MGTIQRKKVTSLLRLAVLSLCLTPLSLSAQVTFERTYGSPQGDAGSSVQETLDGGYVIVGGTESFGAAAVDVYLVETDSLGDTVWTRTYGGDTLDYGLCVQQTMDGGYIIAGRTCSFGAGDNDVYLVKTDSLGDTIWTRTYGGDTLDYGWYVQQTVDGGYIIAGETRSFGAGASDFYVVKTDSLGDSLWTRTYGGASAEHGLCVQQCQDGGYAIVGLTQSFGAGGSDVYVVKTDSLGDSVWTRTYGGTGLDCGRSIRQTDDSGFVIAGLTYSFGAGWADFYVIKTDSLGDSVWARTYGGAYDDMGACVQQTHDGGYVISGYTVSLGAGDFDVYMVKTDSLGDTMWTRTYGGANEDMGTCVQQTQDGGYVVTGHTHSFGAGLNDVYLIKTDENGLTGIEERGTKPHMARPTVRLLQSTPNPFHRSTLISYSLPQTADVTLSIYDIAGRPVETLVNETRQPGVHQVRWNRESNPSGVYFYRLRAGEFVGTRKMVAVE